MGFEGASHIMGSQFAKNVGQAHRNIEATLLKSQGQIKQTAKSEHFDALPYAIGDQVWLSTTNSTLLQVKDCSTRT